MIDPRLSHGALLIVVGATAMWSWQAHYLPSVRILRHSREQLVEVHQRVERTEQLLQAAGGVEQWTAQQQFLLERLKQRLPPRQQTPRLLDSLLEQIAGARLELINVSQGNLEPTKSVDGSPILLDGSPCLELPVTLAVKGRFKNVLAFIREVTGAGFPCVMKLGQIQMTLENSTSGVIRADLQLTLFVLGP